MKRSQIILEEYQEQLKKFDGIEIPMKTISEGLRMFTQAYKDALYMEGQVEKGESCNHIPEGTGRDIDTQYKCRKCGKTIFKIDFDWVVFKK